MWQFLFHLTMGGQDDDRRVPAGERLITVERSAAFDPAVPPLVRARRR
jgi:hypothetical protein